MLYINGFTVGQVSTIGTYTVPGTSVKIPVRRSISPLLMGFASEFNSKVERLRDGWCWGYDNRPVTAGASPSFHAAGIAIDLNAPIHPRGKHGTFSSRQVAIINALCKKYGLRWGGNYVNSPKDEMHFEVIVSQTKALELVKILQGPKRASADAGPVGPFKLAPDQWYGVNDHTNNSHSGVRTDDQPAIKSIQREIGVKADGLFGPTSEHYTVEWQKRYNLTADGKVGVHTWSAMVTK